MARFSLRKKKENLPQIKEDPKFGPPVNVFEVGGVQLASPLLDQDVLEIPMHRLNITYPINPPYAYVNVYYDTNSKEMFYNNLLHKVGLLSVARGKIVVRPGLILS